MPHTFPPRRFRDGEPVDPDVFNETFQSVAGKLSGRLGEQDIDAATLKASVAIADEAYYAAHHFVRAVNPQWALWMNSGSAGDPLAWVYDNTYWNPLIDDGGSTQTQVQFTSSDDMLLIFAQAQHISTAYDTANNPPSLGDTVRLQYALRVDGVLLDDTVTGAFFFPDAPPQEWYRASAVSSADDFDYRHIQYIQNTVGINNAAHGNRIIRALPVQDGTHTVELVARRAPRNDYKLDADGDGMFTRVYNRRIFVLRIKGGVGYTGGVPDVTVNAVDDGEVLTLGSVFTNSLEAMRQTTNALETRHVDRHALRNEHLPSMLYGSDVAYIQPGSSVPFTGHYPGYGTDGAGWTVVNDGMGNYLRITNGATGWRLDQTPGTLVVLANVQLWKISWTGAYGGPANSIERVAIFAIAFTNHLGVRTVLGETEVYVNGHNQTTYGGTTTVYPEGDDVPLMWVVDSASLSADNKRITKIEVLVSQWDAQTGVTGTANVQVNTQRGMITAFVLKGVHPS
jgi:hypothetical protein